MELLFDSEKRKPFNYNTKGYYLVSGCWHMPFSNIKMLSSYIELLKHLYFTKKLVGHFLIGDILDMHSISRHNKGRIKIPNFTLTREYKEANKIFDLFDKYAPDVYKEYIFGNHEAWYSQYMSEIDNYKLGSDVVKSPVEALKLIERGYVVQEDYRNAEIKLGDIYLMHGEWTSKHAAHKHLTELKKNVVFAHTHRISSHMESNYEAFNIGWGGDKTKKAFSYMSKQQKENWRNGFAVIYLDSNAKSHITQIIWKNNKFYFEGEEY